MRSFQAEVIPVVFQLDDPRRADLERGRWRRWRLKVATTARDLCWRALQALRLAPGEAPTPDQFRHILAVVARSAAVALLVMVLLAGADYLASVVKDSRSSDGAAHTKTSAQAAPAEPETTAVAHEPNSAEAVPPRQCESPILNVYAGGVVNLIKGDADTDKQETRSARPTDGKGPRAPPTERSDQPPETESNNPAGAARARQNSAGTSRQDPPTESSGTPVDNGQSNDTPGGSVSENQDTLTPPSNGAITGGGESASPQPGQSESGALQHLFDLPKGVLGRVP
jgi:hypothetical protein